ncbi:hypothetical protein C464_16127 [Halorubrum coriense DSM 10284]|uniref:Uncharacterized protein n=1 Tax=Halorubrum coriense DSM 10284 TaxID=1227466 RepID=M0E9F8_9EURY|nr:hypothetical protein [Halorubrum coriense]ELZ43693.1 hypothetical protein C464_16127 [Halorubrum coriense DSM 10284]
MVDRTLDHRLGSGDDRGQAYTLEGVVSAVLVLTALLLATTAVVITPTTAGTIDRDTMAQLGTQTDDVLTAAHERGTLREAALFWNVTGGQSGWSDWRVSQECPTAADGEKLTLCELLQETFNSRFYRYNVYLDYQTKEKTTQTEPLFVQGTPGRNAVSATRSVALHDGMNLTHPSGGNLEENASEFYAEDLEDPTLVNVVQIRVVVW